MHEVKQKKQQTDWVFSYRYKIVFVFAFLLYINTVPNDYNLDDELVITTDATQPHRLTSKGISALPEIFTEPYYKDDQGYSYDYRPIVLATFALEHTLFGGTTHNPHVSHFVNVILYALLCVLLLYTLSLLFNSYSWLLAFTAALLFSAHPIHTEIVASIKNRDEILALGFCLVSLVYLLKASHTPKQWIYLLLSTFFFGVALLSKQTIISFAILTPIAVILFGNVRWFIVVLFSVIAASLYVPLSNLVSTKYALFFVSLFPIASLFILAIKRVNVSDYRQSVSATLLSIATKKNKLISFLHRDADEMFHLNLISATQFYIISVVLFGLSAALYFSQISFWTAPIFCIYSLPFLLAVKHQKNAFILLFATTLLLYFVLPVSDRLFILTGAYFNLALIQTNSNYFKSFSVLLVIARAIKDPWFGLEIFITITTWLNLPSKYMKLTRWVSYAFGLFALFQLVSVVTMDKFSFPDLSKSLIGVLLLGWTFNIRRYFFIPICALMFVVNVRTPTINTNVNLEPYINTLNVPTPKVIPESEIDRPVNFVESVTNYLSPIDEQLGTAMQVSRKCFNGLLLPWQQSFYYGYKIIDLQSVFTLGNMLTSLFLFVLGFCSILTVRRHPIISLGLMILVVGIIAFSGILVSIPGMMADRFLLIPSIGFSVLIAYGVLLYFQPADLSSQKPTIWNNQPKNWRYVLYILLLFYSFFTISRNFKWKNHLTLYGADIGHLAESVQANNLYALQLMKYSFTDEHKNEQRQMWEKAESHLKIALSIYPKFENAQFDLARIQSNLGKLKEAETSFYKAALLNPEFPPTWIGAIDIALGQKRVADARKYCWEGLKALPNESQLYGKLSYTYFVESKYDSANLINKQALARFPTLPQFAMNIAQTFTSMKQIDSAVYYYKQALVLKPNDPELIQMINILQPKGEH